MKMIILEILLIISIVTNILIYLLLSKKYKTNLDKALNSTVKSFKGGCIAILHKEETNVDELDKVVFKGRTDMNFNYKNGSTENFKKVRAIKIEPRFNNIEVTLNDATPIDIPFYRLKSYDIIQYTQKTTKITVTV